MKTKLVTIDAQTLAGNPWMSKYVNDAKQLSVPVDIVDADGGIAFYISQLAAVEAQVYETPYSDITYLEDVPVQPGIPETAQFWNYRSYDGVALGKFIGANAQDLPKVAQSAKLHQVPLGYAGVECGYTLDELRVSAAMNMPIDTMQQQLAYRGAEEHCQRTAYFGNADLSMGGLFNNSNVTVASAAVVYTSATGQQLFDMLNDKMFQIMKLSKNYHLPDTVLVFPEFWKQMTSTLMTGYQTRTVMEHFMLNNCFTLMTGRPVTIKVRYQLNAANLAAAGVSNGSKDRVVIYEKNQRNLAIAKPIPFRMVAPQYAGLGIKVPCEYKISGTEIRYPLSTLYLDML